MKKLIAVIAAALLMIFCTCAASAENEVQNHGIYPPEITSLTDSADGVQITWSDSTDSPLYRVYIKSSSGWTRIAEVSGLAPTYLDRDIKPGETRTYTVRGVDENGSFTTYFNTAGRKHTHYLETPEITELSSSAQGVSIKWSAVEGAERYRVYYKGRNGWTRMSETSGTSYLDKDVSFGSSYTYTVRCVSSSGAFTSDYNSAGKRYTHYLKTPEITGCESTGKGVNIKWNPVDDAAKYRVYYYGRNGWTKMGESTGTSFIDSDVNVGSAYRYTVRCISADLKTFTSDFDHTGIRYTYKPELDTPQITRVEAAAKGVNITWNSVDGADLYRVYYKGSKGWTKMADVRGTSYLDTDVSGGHTYTYTVRCLSQGGKSFASGYNSSGYKFYLFKNPEITDTTVYMDRIEVNVFAARCHNVRVYRKSAGGSWTRLGEIDTEADSAFADYNVEPGKTYTYTARCVSPEGVFLSYFDSKGKSQKYTAADCYPELEFFDYDGDNIALVHTKDDNKLGLTSFDLHFFSDGDYKGTFNITDEPVYIRADFFKEGGEYLTYLVGTDSSGKEITNANEIWVEALGAPTDVKAEITGDCQYRLSWSPSRYAGGYSVILSNGESTIDYDEIHALALDLDLSDYPTDTRWQAIVWAYSNDGVSISWPVMIELSDAEPQQ